MKHTSITHLPINDPQPIAKDVRDKLRAAISTLDGLLPNVSRRSRCEDRVTEQEIRAVLKARRNRDRFFADDLFADPAWDMLLELYSAELGQWRMSVTSLSAGSGVPATTALRWIAILEKNQLVVRRNDPMDGRRVFIELSSEGLEAMRSYFESNPLPII